LIPFGNLTEIKEDTILSINHLGMSTALKLCRTHPAAVILRRGSYSGHAAGLLNGCSIPLFILKDPKQRLPKGHIYVNGKKGIVSIEPPKEKKTPHNGIVGAPTNIYYKGEPVKVLVDGKNHIDLEQGILAGANGIGILKTEWMNWNSNDYPSIEEHLKVYETCQEHIGDNLLVVRLFDIGGDKVPKWAEKKKKLLASPLGFRGIRGRELFKKAFDQQLQAIAKFSEKQKVGVVIPMVTHTKEVERIKETILNMTAKNGNILIGAMIETPSAALEAGTLADVCDFFRIGTGDLSQFTLATLRENITPQDFSKNGLSNSVMKLIEVATKTVKRKNGNINICLDFNPDKKFLTELLKIGIRNICVPAHNVRPTSKYLKEICDKS